ncbi:MAG: hypothetical protein ABIJ08_01785 [Nanoarchaeota archaeon]
MKTQIFGIVLICFLLIMGVYAFGPHTRFTHLNEKCIYYSAPTQSCQVSKIHCDPTGLDKYVILAKETCISPLEEAEPVVEPAPVQYVEKIKEVPVPFPVPIEPSAPEQMAPLQEPNMSYLLVLVPILLIFVILVTLWLIYLNKYHKVRDQLVALKKKDSAVRKELKVNKSVKTAKKK